MANPKKITDFSPDKVQQQLIQALRRNQGSGTVADLVSLTGLPKYQVSTMLPVVVDECRGHMQVTQSGEVLYRFPQGLTNQSRGAAATWKKWTRKALATSATVLKALFKAWIVVMLVGYFALFVFILLAALILSIALSFAKRDGERDDSGGGFMGFYLVTRVFEFFLLLWMYSGDPVNRDQKKKKSFFKAVFEFVFGVEEKPEVREKLVKKAVVAAIQENKGSITLEELMRQTGYSRADSDRLINRLMLEMEGEPKVSEQGTLYFFFPELLRTSSQTSLTSSRLPEAPLIPFTRNPAKTNRWIGFLNGFNLVLSGYFLGFGATGFEALQTSREPLSLVYQLTVIVVANTFGLGLAEAEATIALVLGFVPLSYSAFFFGIPLIRRWREKRRNEAIKTGNLRRKVVARVMENPETVSLGSIEPSEPVSLKESLLRDLADSRTIDVVGDSQTVYRVPDLKREQDDMVQVRQSINLEDYRLGKVIFDTEDALE